MVSAQPLLGSAWVDRRSSHEALPKKPLSNKDGGIGGWDLKSEKVEGASTIPQGWVNQTLPSLYYKIQASNPIFCSSFFLVFWFYQVQTLGRIDV